MIIVYDINRLIILTNNVKLKQYVFISCTSITTDCHSLMHMLYCVIYSMYSMIIDTPLMTPTTPTSDIMMIMVPYSLKPGAYEGDMTVKY